MIIETVIVLTVVFVFYVAGFLFGYLTGVNQAAELAQIEAPDEPLVFGNDLHDELTGAPTAADLRDEEEED